jgi:hypothetical protein
MKLIDKVLVLVTCRLKKLVHSPCAVSQVQLCSCFLVSSLADICGNVLHEKRNQANVRNATRNDNLNVG